MSAEFNKLLFLRNFTKALSFSTLFLIFAGGLVKSTNSGLAVPDWPLSYGSFFPPMVGGVFYEHGHRMVATFVGFLTLCAAVLVSIWETRRWVKVLAWSALSAVILQGVLGGLTVIFFLPDWISISHGLLAQTFFCLTIVLAYAFSAEREERGQQESSSDKRFLKLALTLIGVIYLQLFLGALMRHTESGLAIPDFPKMGGYWFPPFNGEMLARINSWRFYENLDAVTIAQVWIHFLHRVGALIVTAVFLLINFFGLEIFRSRPKIISTIFFLDLMVVLQILLGITAILSKKEPMVTSLHVVLGAGILGMSILLLLRVAPVQWNRLIKILGNE